MSTLKTTYLQHPSATSPNIELNADGTVTVLPNGLLQVVQTVKSDAQTGSLASGAVTAVTSLSVTITPSAASSKVLITGFVSGIMEDTGRSIGIILKRASTVIAAGDVTGTQTAVHTFLPSNAGSFDAASAAIEYLDSPATTSSVTHSVDIVNLGGGTSTYYINRTSDAGTLPPNGRGVCVLTATEVAA